MHDKGLSRPFGARSRNAEISDPYDAREGLNNSGNGTFVITAIAALPRYPGRFEVDVNGRSFATLSVDALERMRISVGSDIGDRVDAVLAESAALAVYDRALNMLAFRARSARELARALVRKGADREHVEQAIARLVEQGFVDDAKFARAFSRAKVVGASHSRRRVQQDLLRKGVSRDVADTAIDATFEEEGIDRSALVVAAARKKLRTLAGLEVDVRRRRLYGFLARRGFDADDIRAAMSAFGARLDEGTDR